MNFKRVFILFVLMVVPIFIGLFARFNDLSQWQKFHKFFYYDNKPLFTSYDAYFFGRWAKEDIKGTYKAGEVDPLRFVPDNFITGNVTYPSPIPMESWMGAVISKVFHVPLEVVALYLTPILAVLFVVPFVIYFYREGLPLTGFTGALLGVISLIYLVRTSIVRFDTDSLNLFFPFAIALFLYLTLNERNIKKRYLYLVVAGVLSYLYYWWYAHSGLILVMFVTFAIFDFFFAKRRGNEYLKDLGILFLFANPLVIVSGVFNLIGLTKTYILNFFKPAVHGGFPNVFMSISEAKHFSVMKISDLTAGNFVLFLIGIVGLALLILRKFRETFLLLPILLIGLMALKSGNRFAMYLAPFVGAGVGFLCDYAVSLIKDENRKKLYYTVAFVAVFAVIVFFNRNAIKFFITPKITPALASDFTKLKELTPEGSWIWTWWDYGTAIQYYAGRGVFHDGQSQFSPKTYFVATTYSTSTPKIAHNVITGIANVGNHGITKLFKEGKKAAEIRDMFFEGEFSKPLKHPVYWAFTGDEIGKFGWINYFGTWNFNEEKGIKSPIYDLGICIPQKGNIVQCQKAVIDLKKGEVVLGKKAVPIALLAVRDLSRVKEKTYRRAGVIAELVEDKRKVLRAYVMGVQPFKSMFNQMYILRVYDPKYFELVYDDFPTMVLYKVK